MPHSWKGSVKRMKDLKILGVGVFTLMLVSLCLFGLDYVLSDDSKSYARIQMHELYEQEDIDSLFLGASHVYGGLNPAVTDEVWNQNTFSCSTSSQRINTSYALLKEADKVADIDTCYLEMSAKGVTKEVGEGLLDEVYRVADYLKPSWNRVSYLLNAVPSEQYVNAFWRTRRNWKSIYSLSKMKRTISNKRTEAYKNYEYATDTEHYVGKGFIHFTAEFNNVAIGIREPIKNPVSEDYRHYFQKTVEYCRENDIKLICFGIPLCEFTMETIGNYDVYYKEAKELCEQYGVPYYDFNLANPAVLDLQDNDFRDVNHLNAAGAEKFSRVFAEFFAGKIDEEKLFYDSYEQKRNHLTKRFIGLALKRDKSSKFCEIRPITTKEDDYEYEVYYEDENKDYILLQEKSPNLKIAMPKKEKTRLKIRIFDSKGNKVAGFVKSV